MINFGRQILKNILTSWGSYVARVLIAFFFIPYITTTLGETHYGVWVILFQLVNYLSLLDLGLERAVTRFISKHVASNDFGAVNRVIAASTRIYLVLGGLALAGSVVVSTVILDQFDISSPGLLEDARSAVIVIGLFLSFRFWLLPVGGNLHSFQRADIANLFGLGEELLRAGLLTILLYAGGSLTDLAIGILGLSILRQVISAIWLKGRFPDLRFGLAGDNAEVRRELYRYSRFSFGIALAAILLYGSDSVLLGLLVSSSAAGVYAPGAQLLLYVRQIVNSAASVISPAVSRLEANGDWDAIRQVYLMSVKYAMYLSVTAAVGVEFYAKPFVRLWLQPEFEASAGVMMVLALGSLFFLTQIIGNSILFAIEKHKYLFYLTIAEAIAKLILAFCLIEPLGLIGVAWATSIPQLLFYALAYPILMGRVLSLKPGQIWAAMGKPLLIGGLILIPLGWFMTSIFPAESWSALMVNVLVIGLAAGLIVRRVACPGEAALYRRLNRSSKVSE